MKKPQKTAVITDIIANLAMILYWQCKFRPSKLTLLILPVVSKCVWNHTDIYYIVSESAHWYWQYHSVRSEDKKCINYRYLYKNNLKSNITREKQQWN